MNFAPVPFIDPQSLPQKVQVEDFSQNKYLPNIEPAIKTTNSSSLRLPTENSRKFRKILPKLTSKQNLLKLNMNDIKNMELPAELSQGLQNQQKKVDAKMRRKALLSHSLWSSNQIELRKEPKKTEWDLTEGKTLFERKRKYLKVTNETAQVIQGDVFVNTNKVSSLYGVGEIIKFKDEVERAKYALSSPYVRSKMPVILSDCQFVADHDLLFADDYGGEWEMFYEKKKEICKGFSYEHTGKRNVRHPTCIKETYNYGSRVLYVYRKVPFGKLQL